MKFKEFIENEETHGIFSGRFQPVTIAHTKIIDKMSKENKEVTIFLVKGKKTSKDKDKNPFDAEIQKKMLDLVSPKNVQIKIINTGFFVDELNLMPDKTNFIVYAGSDRIKAYTSYKKYLEDNRTLNVVEIPRTDDDISATEVRLSIINDDIETFKRLTDNRIHFLFDTLKSEIH